MIVCAGDIESFSFAQPIGIGLIDTAINLSKIAMISPPEFILFVGTAGSYGDIGLLELIESKTACNIEHAQINGSGYTPLDNLISSSGDVSHETIINSSNYITTDSRVSKEYLSLGISLENMEFFSVLSVAKAFNIPAGGLFCTTNYCDEQAHESFMKNRAKAMSLIEEYLKERSVI